jgi:UDP-glucose 4-epimerase
LFNTVGPRQSGKYGMVIPRFVKASIDKKPINIFGDGSQTRVFCHVSDTVRAILNLAVLEETIGEVFNIGGKGEVSILELANLVIKIGNSSSDITFTDYSEAYPIGFEDMLRRVPDISKIVTTTGWTPNIDLKTIIEDVYKSFR